MMCSSENPPGQKNEDSKVDWKSFLALEFSYQSLPKPLCNPLQTILTNPETTKPSKIKNVHPWCRQFVCGGHLSNIDCVGSRPCESEVDNATDTDSHVTGLPKMLIIIMMSSVISCVQFAGHHHQDCSLTAPGRTWQPNNQRSKTSLVLTQTASDLASKCTSMESRPVSLIIKLENMVWSVLGATRDA